MITFDERVRALDAWRLTPRQARFVVTVALHSGYCLRRHYMAFAGLHYGKVVRDFLDHLVARRLAVRETCRADRGFLYHLHAKAIYRALQQADNRHRRRASLAAIGRKLMVLDAVLTQRDVEWYATQDDKVEFFTQQCGVSLVDLPQQTYASYAERTAPATRYFPHKVPIYATGEPRTVHFVALALDHTGEGFARFLHDHARLLGHLPAWTMLVVHPAGAARAAAACRAVFARYQHGMPSAPTRDRADLVRHFTVRRAVERNDLASLSVADLHGFRESRPRFADATVESLYGRWLAGADRAFADHVATPHQRAASTGQLVLRELPFTYEQFGDFAGVC